MLAIRVLFLTGSAKGQFRMGIQGLLVKLCISGLLPSTGRRLLEKRAWKIESGEGAGLRMALPQNLDYLVGASELAVQRCLASNLSPGDVFYDIGANVGFFSLVAARLIGPEGCVYAFEPVSENVAAIERNARLNAFGNISVLPVALEAKSGTSDLLLTAWDGGASLSNSKVAPSAPLQRRTVRVAALDDLVEVKRLRPPTLVKIDVEGSEIGVLTGMLNTINSFKPALVYEIDDGDKAGFEQRWHALDEFVASLGYRVRHLENSYPNLSWHVGHSLAVRADGDPW